MATKYTNDHPECLPGEIYMSNSTIDNYNRMRYKSKRMGTTAYGTDGKILSPGSQKILWPVFVSEVEFRAVQKSWDAFFD